VTVPKSVFSTSGSISDYSLFNFVPDAGGTAMTAMASDIEDIEHKGGVIECHSESPSP
jgi:hypothetical protein